MESRISVILNRKIIDAAKGYIIETNWKAEDYADRSSELIDDIIDSVATDLKNNNAREEEDKLNMMNDLTDKIEKALKRFEEEHDHDMLSYYQQIRDKKESFAFEVTGSEK